MTQKRERMLEDLDREISAAEDHLRRLKDARRAIAATLSPQKKVLVRAPTTSPSRETDSVEAALVLVLQDGQAKSVEMVFEALKHSGADWTRGTINMALHRGTLRGVFERVARGLYRLAPAFFVEMEVPSAAQ